MSMFTPICPARAIYGQIERLEARREQLCLVAQAVAAGDWLRRDALLERLEALDQALILEGEAARDELSGVGAATAEGAVCQMIAAMRDLRSGEPELQRRASRLIARSAAFTGTQTA